MTSLIMNGVVVRFVFYALIFLPGIFPLIVMIIIFIQFIIHPIKLRELINTLLCGMP